MNIVECFITDVLKYNPELIRNFETLKIITPPEKVVAEFAFSILKKCDFSFSAMIFKKYHVLYSNFIKSEKGTESLEEFLSDLLYPLHNMKLFNLVTDKLGFTDDEDKKNGLCISAFFANNLKAYKKIESDMSTKVNYEKMFELMMNSTPVIINDNSSGQHMMKSNKACFDYVITKMEISDLNKLNNKYDINAKNNSDFICEFIIKKVHSWDFIYYLNDEIKDKYKDLLSEKIQYLMLHSDNKARNFIHLIVKEKLINKDNFNYEFLYKKNNVLLLKEIDPEFFENTRNINFYENLVDFVVNKVLEYKDCYNFIEGFITVKDQGILQDNIKYLKRYFLKSYIIDVQSFEDRIIEINADRFFNEHIAKNYFKEESQFISKEEKLALLENELIKENISVHDCIIKKKRI